MARKDDEKRLRTLRTRRMAVQKGARTLTAAERRQLDLDISRLETKLQIAPNAPLPSDTEKKATAAKEAAKSTVTDEAGKSVKVTQDTQLTAPDGRSMSVAEAFGLAGAADDKIPLALRGLTPAQERQFIQTFNTQFGTKFDALKGITGNPGILVHPALGASDIQLSTPDLEGRRRTAARLGEDGRAYRDAVEKPEAAIADKSRVNTQHYEAAISLNGRSAPYMKSVVVGAAEAGVPWQVLWGLIHSESSFNSNVSHGIPTVKGIAGIDTRYHKVNATDPNASIKYAGQLLAQHFAKYKDYGLALIAYKFGPELADRIFSGQPVDPGRLSYAHELVSRVFEPAQKMGWDGKGALDPQALTELAQSGGQQAYSPPDPVKVKQASEQLIKGLFFRDPTAGEVEAVQGMVSGLFAEANVRARQGTSSQSPYAARAAASEPNAVAHPLGGAGRTTGQFGDDRKTHKHGGLDLAAETGTPVQAAVSGVVIHRNDPNGFGTYAVLKGDDGREYIYAHLSGHTVEPGSRVQRGQTIAKVGNTGKSTGPHLHFEIRDKKAGKLDPEKILAGSVHMPSEEGAPVSDQHAPDPDAHILEQFRSSPEYARLYGDKPAHLDESQYASKFATAGIQAANSDTAVVSDEAIRGGLVSGKTGTTAGAVALNPDSMESGSFRGRLYEVARLLNRFA